MQRIKHKLNKKYNALKKRLTAVRNHATCWRIYGIANGSSYCCYSKWDKSKQVQGWPTPWWGIGLNFGNSLNDFD